MLLLSNKSRCMITSNTGSILQIHVEKCLFHKSSFKACWILKFWCLLVLKSLIMSFTRQSLTIRQQCSTLESNYCLALMLFIYSRPYISVTIPFVNISQMAPCFRVFKATWQLSISFHFQLITFTPFFADSMEMALFSEVICGHHSDWSNAPLHSRRSHF